MNLAFIHNNDQTVRGHFQEIDMLIQGADIRSQYETTRFVSRFISGVGWLFFWINVVLFLPFLISLIYLLLNGGGMVSLVPGAFLVAGAFMMALSLLLVAAGQVTRAIVENSDHTCEILQLLQTRSPPTASKSVLVESPAPAKKKPIPARAIIDGEIIRCGNQDCKRILTDVNSTCSHCGAVNS